MTWIEAFSKPRVILYLFYAGLLVYFLGVIVGFFEATVSVSPLFLNLLKIFSPLPPLVIFESYPRYILVFSAQQSPIFYTKFSFLSIILLILMFSTAISAHFKNLRKVTLILSLLVTIIALLHYFILMPITGTYPFGFEIVGGSSVSNTPLLQNFFVVSCFKNLYLILIPTILILGGLLLLIMEILEEKAAQFPTTSLTKSFQAYKSVIASATIIFLIPFYVILSATFLFRFYEGFFRFEFPYFYLETTPNNVFFYSIYIFLVLSLFFIILLLEFNTQVLNTLIEVCIPRFEKEFKNMKPLIPVEEFIEKLELDLVDRRTFKRVLIGAAKNIENRETIHFAVFSNHIYLKEPLVSIARDEIKRNGYANISEVAIKIKADPKKLKTAFIRLKEENLLENIRISKDKIIPSGGG